ncbi:adenosine deaminase-like growth [Gloeophyllum trabeum ATCC 11539]|uniref:adenosine deaminase n=1 Tax=Gloeophyllum trabeum (strain ATCC 11539 / FP-39264 / Madison 617) TaxID=670483 RepID=S7RTR4_GLOTA|nr:adenosine deaminase-like growth [Gloeophyllum trabeum ATCC 11539]EPQ58065.1 adenosine deaminase-like growth [Gloeophyllum trabeum ATCC 11539]
MSPPSVGEYLSKRDAFINDERSLRREHARLNALSDAEAQADTVVRQIRADEAKTIWTDDNENMPHVFPGMEFLTSRDLIVKTKLFNILAKMPKGALLHAHLDAMVNVRTLLRLALQHPAFHIRVPASLTAASLKTTLPEVRPRPKAEWSALSSLRDAAAGEWVPLQQARANFDPALGGPEGFDDWVVGHLTINPAEAYGTHKTTDKIWEKFANTFRVASGLIRYAPIWYPYIREFFRTSIDDGISYIEVRINFGYKTMFNAEGYDVVPAREWVRDFERALRDTQQELKDQGRQDVFHGARIIYTTIRMYTPDEMEWYLDECLALKQEFPDIIAGFDLVGHEDSLHPLIHYIQPLLRFRARQAELGLDIPFIFHAGETLGDGTPADVNLYDAILLGTKRIGHGFSLAKHPKLMEICKERGIAVEMCPISNEILRLTSSMPMHPLPIIVNHGIPVALCSDDPAVFGNMGLSYDYFQVLVASEVTGLTTLGQIARDSLEFSTLDAEAKGKALAAWEKRWQEFCNEVAALGK